MLPDLEGEQKGAGRGGKRGSLQFKMPDPEQPLPAELRVPLGKTLALGDLEVTPERVERRVPAWVIGRTEQPFPEDVLVVRLRLRNRSRDDSFYPLDRYFFREVSKAGGGRPYTYLEMGDHKFPGGPLNIARKNEFIKGQDVGKELKPGEEMTTFVCTNPAQHAIKALDGYSGPLLWRVQLRRGLVKWTTRDGVDREDPATTVVGIEFSADDVQKSAD
jgi:hypothetical protein